MTATNDWKENNIDQLYEWAMDNKYDECCDYCNGEVSTLDDDHEAMWEYYVTSNEAKLWEEYLELVSI